MTKALFGTTSSLFLTLHLYGYTEISGIVLNILLLYTNNEKLQSVDCELSRFPLGTTRIRISFSPYLSSIRLQDFGSHYFTNYRLLIHSTKFFI